MDTVDTTKITVVIPTRNRGDNVIRTIQTVLLNDYPYFEVTIVDQSEDDLTEASIRPLLANPHIHYIRTATKGLSTGLNVGISNARTEFIAITGDDCELQKDFLEQLVAAFEIDPRIAVVFGNVLPGPHDRSVGFVPAYSLNRKFLARSVSAKHRVGGTSACMGLRRSVWKVLGEFDQMLGVGAPLEAAEDTDFAIRALLRGYFVYETPTLTVTHHGLYPWEQCRNVIHRYWYGTGAAFVKYLKCGYCSVMVVLLRLAWGWIFNRSRIGASLGTHPYRLGGLVAFARGFAMGFITRVDKRRCKYIGETNEDEARRVHTRPA